MAEIRDIYLNKDLRVGGFYELTIQVCPSTNMEPIKKYTEYIKSLKNVDGPFDRNFEPINIEIETFDKDAEQAERSEIENKNSNEAETETNIFAKPSPTPVQKKGVKRN